jgi:hypothetical protein
MYDQTLATIAQDIAKWNGTKGELGLLRKQYTDYSKMAGGLRVASNLPQGEKERRLNLIVKAQQDNLQQQHLAIKYKEAQLAEQYGQVLAPRLEGRGVSMKSLDQMMREHIATQK